MTGTGTGQRLFAEPTPSADETTFQVDNTSAAYYDSPYYKLHQDQLQPVPTPPPRAPLKLADIVPRDLLAPFAKARRMVFHAVGDTGASVTRAIASEAGVADAMSADLARPEAPAFLFHLGDVIYNFGEAVYYYDQFYEPFRAYDRPIFAIPGNHDGIVQYGADPTTPLAPTLQAFLRNFCAPTPGPSPDAGGLVRSTMTQPGAYFTLEAPLVSIIGLYTNVLEGPGVISSQGGAYPVLDDRQLQWLTSELARLKPERARGRHAVILACHHPPVSADAKHGGSTGQAADLDHAFTASGLWPDAVLSGHAHLYQRFTRSTGQRQIPYIVAGSGGHNLTLPSGELTGKAPITWGEYTLVREPILHYGYLTVTVDCGTPGAGTLTITFNAPADPSATDQVTVDLATSTLAV